MNYCVECEYMDLKRYNSWNPDKKYCLKKEKYYYQNSEACKNDYKKKEQTLSSSSCYLTTIVVDILNEENGCDTLNILRNFRQNYLQKNNKEILFEYDVIGPYLSEAIKKDDLKEKMAKMLYVNYIEVVKNLVLNNQLEKAIIKYKEMVNNLKIFYHMEKYDINNNIELQNKVTGKGYLKKNID